MKVKKVDQRTKAILGLGNEASSAVREFLDNPETQVQVEFFLNGADAFGLGLFCCFVLARE